MQVSNNPLLNIAEVITGAPSAILRAAGPRSKYKDQMKTPLYLTSPTVEGILVPWELILFWHLSPQTNRRNHIIIKLIFTMNSHCKKA